MMDPVPMFVGDVDGIRRHTIGAGLTPLGQPLARLETRTASDATDDGPPSGSTQIVIA